jgi:hypothetical protein
MQQQPSTAAAACDGGHATAAAACNRGLQQWPAAAGPAAAYSSGLQQRATAGGFSRHSTQAQPATLPPWSCCWSRHWGWQEGGWSNACPLLPATSCAAAGCTSAAHQQGRHGVRPKATIPVPVPSASWRHSSMHVGAAGSHMPGGGDESARNCRGAAAPPPEVAGVTVQTFRSGRFPSLLWGGTCQLLST